MQGIEIAKLELKYLRWTAYCNDEYDEEIKNSGKVGRLEKNV